MGTLPVLTQPIKPPKPTPEEQSQLVKNVFQKLNIQETPELIKVFQTFIHLF